MASPLFCWTIDDEFPIVFGIPNGPTKRGVMNCRSKELIRALTPTPRSDKCPILWKAPVLPIWPAEELAGATGGKAWEST